MVFFLMEILMIEYNIKEIRVYIQIVVNVMKTERAIWKISLRDKI